MFTGDASGDFLFPALHRAGFASKDKSERMNDDLILKDMFITAVCRCVPPDNKPTSDEISNCRNYLESEIRMMENLKVIVTLGAIAHKEIQHYLLLKKGYQNLHPFSHLGITRINELGISVISSYHPSRQNTQTGKLTKEMFDRVWKRVKEIKNNSDLN
jgi:uracil-DNA glycosylase family 4